MNLTENAEKILKKRYYLRDKDNNIIEDWEKLCRRVCNFASTSEKNEKKQEWSEKFFEKMYNLKFIPSSPTLFNAGTKDPMCHACYTLEIQDSMEDIFRAVKDSSKIYKTGGGVGFYFGNLRPKNSPVSGTGGISSGPISFMQVFDVTVDVVKQGAKRRGAALGCMPITHPDIEDFIICKNNKKSFNNFNISVSITDEFMKAVENDSEIELSHPSSLEKKKIKAKKIWNKIVKSAHSTGDPGLLFIDTINKFNPIPDEELHVVNPCGETPLNDRESCVLGHINLVKFIQDDQVDYDGLSETVEMGVRFLDNTIDLAKYPLPEISKATKRNRKIGLGIMGFADMLIMLGIKYDSSEGVKFGDQLMGFINKKAFYYSTKIGEEKGSFPNFENSIFKGKTKHYKKPRYLRNATRTVVAPTGTTSVIAGVSSGIEPNFAFEYNRESSDGVKLDWIHPLFKKATEDGIIKKKGKIFVTAKDIDPDWHLKMQQAFQLHTDLAISKTINMPYRTPIKEIKRIYRKAHEMSLKGITIFRDGCKGKQVLYDNKLRCPKCKKYTLEMVEGCETCRACGYSACSLN